MQETAQVHSSVLDIGSELIENTVYYTLVGVHTV